MNNQEYEKHIESNLEVLDELIKHSYQIGKDVIGETLFKEDLFFVAILNRFATLTSGFHTLIKERNLTCCGELLRLQLDNCMRLYGLDIAEDMSNAIDTVMSGGRFDKLKDKNGKQMKDGYLKEQISNFDSRLKMYIIQHQGTFILLIKAFSKVFVQRRIIAFHCKFLKRQAKNLIRC